MQISKCPQLGKSQKWHGVIAVIDRVWEKKRHSEPFVLIAHALERRSFCYAMRSYTELY